MTKQRPQRTPATLGDVLYANTKAPVTEQTWATLVQSIAAGDQLALHTLYEMAHRIVFTLIMRITGNRETRSMSSTTSGGARRVTTPRTARCSAGS
jgi:RNA polymerase sigma-70 factor, ECF subfamily